MTSSAAPSVTVGIPVFNGERYLAEALGSLQAQDYTDFEAIIADNASDDGTQEIARSFVDATHVLSTSGTTRTSVAQGTQTCSSKWHVRPTSSGLITTTSARQIFSEACIRFSRRQDLRRWSRTRE